MTGRLGNAVTHRCLGAVALVPLILAASSGCRSPDERLQVDAAPEPAPVLLRMHRTVIGFSVEGRPIECVELGNGRDVVLIMATIHGSEPAGTPLVQRLVGYLSDRPDLLEGRRVLLLPVANPDGFASGNRHNAHGIDLNRNFPASNYHSADHHGPAALSEPESVAIHRMLEGCRPNRIVSIHQPIACIDYDGPAEALALAMAEHTDLPVKKLGGRAGSLGSYVGITLGIPIITVELPRAASGLEGRVLWERYGSMLLAAVRFPEPLHLNVLRPMD